MNHNKKSHEITSKYALFEITILAIGWYKLIACIPFVLVELGSGDDENIYTKPHLLFISICFYSNFNGVCFYL